MTAPQQPQGYDSRQQALADALAQAQSQQDATNVLVLFLLLDQPTANYLVTVLWPTRSLNSHPWQKPPTSEPALIQAQYLDNAADRIHAAFNEAAAERRQAEVAQAQPPPVVPQILPGEVAAPAEHEPSPGTTPAEVEAEAKRKALEAEARYAKQHRRAQAKRATAQADARKARRKYGNLLGWYAHHDDKVTPACRIADKANFNATTGPIPGTLHGGSCRCQPGPAFNTSRMVVGEWIKAGLGERAEGAA